MYPMHKLIQDLFGRLSGPDKTSTPSEKDLRIAAALLLIEIGQADNEWQDSEVQTIVSRLATLFDLDRQAAEALFQEARQRDAEHVSLHPTLKIINEHFTPEQKQQVITDCWRVAFADGVLDHYEEHQIRRIAELLYLPHSKFIQAKLKAQAERDAGNARPHGNDDV